MVMLKIVDQILQDKDRTPAWLCRQAGVHRSNYTKIKNGQINLTENMKHRFSKVLGIRVNILFPNEPKENK
tara:strand:- start:4019 stop:4231 length:213 start_codon:yes stop_codon:yes gene_type:complete